MADTNTESELTAVDDVRRVRERLDKESGGDLRKHVEETNRIFERLKAQLNVKVVPVPKDAEVRSGI